MAPTFQSLYADEIVNVEVHRNLFLVAWYDAPRLEQVRAIRRIAAPIAKKHTGGTAMFDLIVRGTPSFEEEMRKELKKATEDPWITLGTAHVIVPTGLVGAATRAFLTTMFLIGRLKVPNKVFASPEGAAPWLLERLSLSKEAWSSDELREVVTRFAAAKLA